MRSNLFLRMAIGLVVALFSLAAMAALTQEGSLKTVKDMVLDPAGFVHVGDDGIARSYAANGTVIDFAPLSPAQLAKMVDDLPSDLDTDKEHVSEAFSGVNGFAVKDRHQIFHPSTELRPAVDPATTHYTDDTSVNEPREVKALLENREAGKKDGDLPALCQGEYCHNNEDCAKIGCPGDSCYYLGRWFVKTCHDLMW